MMEISHGAVHQAQWLGLRLRGSGERQGNLRMSNKFQQHSECIMGGDQKMVHDLRFMMVYAHPTGLGLLGLAITNPELVEV